MPVLVNHYSPNVNDNAENIIKTRGNHHKIAPAQTDPSTKSNYKPLSECEHKQVSKILATGIRISYHCQMQSFNSNYVSSFHNSHNLNYSSRSRHNN